MKMRILFLAMVLVMILPVMAFAGSPTLISTESGAFSATYSNSFPNYLQNGGYPTYLQQIIPGVVGDITNNPDMPQFEGMIPLRTSIIIVDLRTGISVLPQDFDKLLAANVPLAVMAPDKVQKSKDYTRGGRIFGFSRLEDFDSDLINLKPKFLKVLGLGQDDTNFRYKVQFKMESDTSGFNLAAIGQTAWFTTGLNPVGLGSGGNGVIGKTVNRANPVFILKGYKVIPGAITYFNILADQKKSEIEPQRGAVSQSNTTILYQQTPSPPKESVKEVQQINKSVFGKEVSD
jgi:hypothetical protein